MYESTDNVVDHPQTMEKPAQQEQQCGHYKGSNVSTMRAMMPAQLMIPCDESRRQRDEGNNADKVVDAAVGCG
jgi:hypothetical protein